MAKPKKSIKIIPPAQTTDPQEVPPEKENNQFGSAPADGFNLIKWIYDFFVAHDSLMYTTYSKYKNLELNRFLDFCFASISFLVDSIHNIIIYIWVIIILGIIAFSFAKLVGLIDLLLSLHILK